MWDQDTIQEDTFWGFLTVSLGVSGAQLGLDILKGHSRVPTDLQDLRFSDFLITNDRFRFLDRRPVIRK